MSLAYRCRIGAVELEEGGSAATLYLSAGILQPIMAGQKWQARLLDPVWSYNADLPISEAGIGGRSIPSFGVLGVGADGDLDALCTRAFDGRPVTIERQVDGGDWTQVARVTTEQPTWDEAGFTFKLRDFSRLFDQPVQQNRYAGTGGAEGGAELKDTPKPLLFGECFNVEPVVVDPVKRVYQIHDGPILNAYSGAGVNVRERGRGFTTYVEVPDVFAWDPTGKSGTVAIDSTRGLFRLANTPVGLITCDAAVPEETSSGLRSNRHAGVLHRLLLRNATDALLTEVDLASLQALNAADTGVMGLYLKNDETLGDALDTVARSMGGFWSVSAAGVFAARQFAFGVPVASLSSRNLVTAPARTDTEPPVWKLTFRTARTWRPLSDSDIGSAELEDLGGGIEQTGIRALLTARSGYGQAIVEQDDTLRDIRLTARELEVLTLYIQGVHTARSARMMALLGQHRDRYAVAVRGMFETIALGDTVTLTYPRFGLDAGKDFIVVGKSEKPHVCTPSDGRAHVRCDREDVTELRLWGPRTAGDV